MAKNVIFQFSGTGNSLKVAMDIGRAVSNCDIVAMTRNDGYVLEPGLDRIGFVYPAHFLGMPMRAREFAAGLDFSGNRDAYYFAVATCGGFCGNALANMGAILGKSGLNLHYGRKLKMVSNYVVMYKMSRDTDKITRKSDQDIPLIAADIVKKNKTRVGGVNPLFDWYNSIMAKRLPSMDAGFNISAVCVQCGICEKVCPVENIASSESSERRYRHGCTQCMACIQHCPQQAINYKSKTQRRTRYTNPYITYQELSQPIIKV